MGYGKEDHRHISRVKDHKFLVLKSKSLFKQCQRICVTSSNVVECNMLASFEHHVERSLLEFKPA